METKFFKPKSPLLHPFMEGYYFLTHQETEKQISYYTFPNNFNIVSILKNAEIQYSLNSVSVREKKGAPLLSELICSYKKPIKLSYEGTIQEITLSFKPLGLNAFLKQPLSSLTNEFFSSFFPFDDYVTNFNTVWDEKDIEKKRELLEAYWLSKLVGFQHPFLNKIIEDLKNTSADYSISNLAAKYHTSRQNLTKQFELHLCKSPSTFKKIHRFREALKKQVIKTPKENLTTLGYDLLFYDQSHLTKDFKSLTGLTPRHFFKNISQLEKGEICWIFE